MQNYSFIFTWESGCPYLQTFMLLVTFYRVKCNHLVVSFYIVTYLHFRLNLDFNTLDIFSFSHRMSVKAVSVFKTTGTGF